MNNKEKHFTTIVLEVEKRTAIFPKFPFAKVVPNALGAKKVIAHPEYPQELINIPKELAEPNLLLQMLDEAFSSHLAIRLKPDDFWMLIVQGVAQHVQSDSETFRDKLVRHQGKQKVEIRDDALLEDHTRWQYIPDKIIQLMRDNHGANEDLLEVLLPNFSTTTNNEKIAFEIGAMDVFSSYFEYWVSSLCGIPEIELEGTIEDWEEIEKRLRALDILDLEWWTRALLPIIAKIKDSVKGNVDQDFWQSIYKLDEMSGGPYITGWIINFFPYIKVHHRNDSQAWIFGDDAIRKTDLLDGSFVRAEGRNPFLGREDIPHSLKMDCFHTGISKVNFTWHRLGERKSMLLNGGFIGINQDEDTRTLYPEIGWAVTGQE